MPNIWNSLFILLYTCICIYTHTHTINLVPLLFPLLLFSFFHFFFFLLTRVYTFDPTVEIVLFFISGKIWIKRDKYDKNHYKILIHNYPENLKIFLSIYLYYFRNCWRIVCWNFQYFILIKFFNQKYFYIFL